MASKSEETALDLLKRFFSSSGQIPESFQSSLREAFQLKHKCPPEENPSQFRLYLLAEAKRDDELKAVLQAPNEKLRRSIGPRASIGGRPSTNSTSRAPAQTNDQDSVSNENENPVNVIYSQYEGAGPTLKILNDLKKRYSKCEFRSHNSLNPHLGSSPGCLSGNSTKVLIQIERPKRLRSADDYSFLNSDHEQYSETLGIRCRRIAKALLESLEDRNLPFGNPSVMNVDNSIFVGRFMREVDEVKDAKKMKFVAILEPLVPPDLALGRDPVQLILSTLKSYDLFPGQTIAVIGISRVDQSGQARIHPIEIIPGLTVPPPLVETSALRTFNENCSTSPIHLAIASGPFSSNGTLDTFLLDQFIKRIESDVPHVLILLGPFVDVNNRIVASDAPAVRELGSTDARCLSHEDLYRLMLRRIVNSIALKQTTIMIVPSTNDVGHPFPLPQPPFDLKRLLGGLPHQNVHSLSNPCNVLISNVFWLSITSSDPISPTLESIDSTAPPGKKLERAHSLVLQQRTLFPVHPHPEPIDAQNFHRPPCVWQDNRIPDLLIYQCRTGPGVRMYNDRAFINAGCLASSSRPCYCQVWVHPAPIDENASMSHLRLSERLRVDVMDWCEAQSD